MPLWKPFEHTQIGCSLRPCSAARPPAIRVSGSLSFWSSFKSVCFGHPVPQTTPLKKSSEGGALRHCSRHSHICLAALGYLNSHSPTAENIPHHREVCTCGSLAVANAGGGQRGLSRASAAQRNPIYCR